MGADQAILTLDQLQERQAAVVLALTNAGPSRRRLMDLGILPGTRIHIEFRSPLGDPTAYRVRGSVLALRREQAAQIQIMIDKESDNESRTNDGRV